MRTVPKINFLKPQLMFLLLLLPCMDLFAATGKNAAPWVGNTFWNTSCQGGQGMGPYDYNQRHRLKRQFKEIEAAHFTQSVEQLVSGNRGTLKGDLGYTLRAIPNHHRALNSVIQLRLRENKTYSSSEYPPAECYLQRAVNFSPNDGTTRMLLGMLHHRMGHLNEALEHYQEAEKMAPRDIQIKYNLGLALYELGRYEDSRQYADEVYDHGFPLPGLQRKLETKGY